MYLVRIVSCTKACHLENSHKPQNLLVYVENDVSFLDLINSLKWSVLWTLTRCFSSINTINKVLYECSLSWILRSFYEMFLFLLLHVCLALETVRILWFENSKYTDLLTFSKIGSLEVMLQFLGDISAFPLILCLAHVFLLTLTALEMSVYLCVSFFDFLFKADLISVPCCI